MRPDCHTRRRTAKGLPFTLSFAAAVVAVAGNSFAASGRIALSTYVAQDSIQTLRVASEPCGDLRVEVTRNGTAHRLVLAPHSLRAPGLGRRVAGVR